MLWSKFHEQFQKEVMPAGQIAGVDIVYVISHQRGQPPYKIGITESNIYGRLRAYQTPLIDFDILYLIALPRKGAIALEKALHNHSTLKGQRIKFPKKKPEAKVRYSEWFNTTPSTIKTAIWRVSGSAGNLNPYFAYTLSEKKIEQWHALSKFEQHQREKQKLTYKTRSGTVHNKIKRYNPNDEGYEKYRWMKVKSTKAEGSDTGVIIDVPEKRNGKAIIRWSNNVIYPLPIRDVEKYVEEYGITY